MKHHYNKEELVELKRKYDMQVSKKAIEEIKHSIDLAKEIERLKMAVKDTKENADAIIIEQQEEIERLNNIINELEKELREDYKIWMCNSRSNGKSVKFGIDVCKTHFYNRLQELKGDSSNE